MSLLWTTYVSVSVISLYTKCTLSDVINNVFRINQGKSINIYYKNQQLLKNKLLKLGVLTAKTQT